MQLTKHAHSCVEVEHDGRRILIDPGGFTPDTPILLESADAVLVTHAHGDHMSIEALAHAMRSREHLAVYGPEGAVAPLTGEFGGRVRAVVPGETLDVEGLSVSVHGGLHAPVLTGGPREPNVGYLLGGRVYHPGDSLDPPQVEVDTLLVPISGPWMKLADAVDLVAQVNPLRAVAIHEGLLSRTGLELVGRMLGDGGLSSVPVEQFTPGSAVLARRP